MNINPDEARLDEIFSHYNELSRKVSKIDVVASRANLDPLVQEIYEYLLAQVSG